MRDLINDIETYPNCFLISFLNTKDGKIKVFEMSPWKNDWKEFRTFAQNCANGFVRWVGFNNYYFDYPVIHFMLQNFKGEHDGLTLAKAAYEKAQRLIQAGKDEKFQQIIWDNNQLVPQVDLFRIHHFDNVARSTSLKVLEFNMRSETVEDLPFDYRKTLTNEEGRVLVSYNKHDLTETEKFYHKSLEMIRFREELSAKYDRNFLNHNDTKIGKDYFIMELEKAGVKCYNFDDGSRAPNQTKRESIRIRDVIFSYIEFKRPEFNAVLSWLKRQEIRQTKGVFTDIEEHLLGDVAKYAEMDTKRIKFKTKPNEKEVKDFLKLHPLGWVEEQELKALETLKDSQGNPVKETYIDEKTGKEKERVVKVPKMSYYGCFKIASSLNVVVNGFRLDFGQGGAHASLSSTIVKADDYFKVEDADVSSFYPNMAISNKIYPMHLGETFCTIYKDVYVQRQSFKKGTSENAIMKLALNGVFGDSGSEFSPFFDSSFLLKITINGQLSLCLLAERLLEIPELEIIQVNTDGITVKYPRQHEELYYKICDDWQKHVKLELEYADYESMHIANVNNYIARYTNGKVKLKGAYVSDELGWHQNHSAKVIQMAAVAEMLEGVPVEEFIRNHKNKYDFLLRTKVPRSSSLVLLTPLDDEGLEFEETKLQNICRYYACKEGGKLVKVMPPLEGSTDFRRIGIDTDWNVKTCNNIEAFRWDVDYNYYISEAQKLVIKE